MENEYFNTGKEKYNNRDFEGAVLDFTYAIEAEPDVADYYYERGLSSFHLNKKSLALMDLNEAQKLQPNYPFRYSSRAYIKDSCGDTIGAIEDYKRAIELDPEDAVSYNNLGLLQEKLGYEEASKKNFSRADSLAEKSDFLNLISMEDSKKQESEPTNQEADTPNKPGVFSTIFKVFTDKKTFREFVTFVKNGFK